MKQATIVVVGGGYAGIHLLKQLKKELGGKIRLVLIDKNPYHFQKVLLFKAAVDQVDLRIPFTQYCGDEVEFLQGEVQSLAHAEQTLHLQTSEGVQQVSYDYLILAVGSTIREVSPEQGGIALTGVGRAETIRQQLLERMKEAKSIRVAVAGGGITGIETAAELAVWLNGEAKGRVEVLLVNAADRLLTAAPAKVGRRLEQELQQIGVQILHGTKVERFANGTLTFANGTSQPADLCIWTTGLQPNPFIRQLGLPTSPDGRLKVDAKYRVAGTQHLFAIGDAAHICDPQTGQVAGMTCKEAIAEAQCLGKIIKSELAGKDSAGHRAYPSMYCIALGPHNGLVWAQKWGLDFVLTGKLGQKIRAYTWDLGSLIQR